MAEAQSINNRPLPAAGGTRSRVPAKNEQATGQGKALGALKQPDKLEVDWGNFPPGAAPNPAFEPEKLIDKKLGPYELRVLVGAGGMGAVYAAEDMETGQPVALKVLNSEVLGSGSHLSAAFHREGRALALSSGLPNVLELHGLGQDGKYKFIATKFLPGYLTLGQLLAEGGALPLPEAIEIVLSASHGLAGLHDRGLVHRDLKPDNIMTRRGDGPREGTIIDLGLAVPFEESVSANGSIVGTPFYMPPEQYNNQPLTPAADIYPMGEILYTLATGKNSPFNFTNAGGFEHQTYEGVSPQLFDSFPSAAQSIFTKSLALDPQHRQPTAPAFMADMKAYLNHEAAQYASFNEAVTAGIAAAQSAPVPTKGGTLIYFSGQDIKVGFEELINVVFKPEQGYTVFRSDRRGNEGIFVYTRDDVKTVVNSQRQFLQEAATVFKVTAAITAVEVADGLKAEQLIAPGSKLVKMGKTVAGAGGRVSVTGAQYEQHPAVNDKLASAMLKPIIGAELADGIASQLAALDQDKLGLMERELQAKVRRMSNQEFAGLLAQAGVKPEDALKIKTKLDSYEFGRLKTGFVALASGLLTMTAVSCLISKVEPDMNPGLNFALTMLGGHYTNEGIKLLTNKSRDKLFVAGLKALVGSFKNGKIVFDVGRGIAVGVESTRGMGLGKLSAAGWNALMDGLGVKNQYLREGGAMAAFFAPDVVKLSARYLATVQGFKFLSELAANGVVGAAAKYANVIGWVAFASDLTVGAAEHYIVDNPYDRSVLARAKSDWKASETSYLGKFNVIVTDALVSSFADAIIPDKFIDQVKLKDEAAVAGFMEDIGKWVFLAGLRGGTSEEVKGLLAGSLKQLVATPKGKEDFENMQAFIQLKYGKNMTNGQKLIAGLDISVPEQITVSNALLNALMVEATFGGQGKYVAAQLRHAKPIVEAATHSK